MVNVIDKVNNRIAEWPTARLNVWLDLIRDNNDITASTIFDSVDIAWADRSHDTELNESLNSSRISLNLSAIKDAMLSKPAKSCFKNLRNKLSPWSEQTETNTNTNRTLSKSITPSQPSPKRPSNNQSLCQSAKKKLLYDECDSIDDAADSLASATKPKSTSTPNDQSFEMQAQLQLRDLRKATLKLKKICNQSTNENVEVNHSVANKILTAAENIESLTNEIRRLLKDVANEPVCKTPKSVRFILD